MGKGDTDRSVPSRMSDGVSSCMGTSSGAGVGESSCSLSLSDGVGSTDSFVGGTDLLSLLDFPWHVVLCLLQW